MSSPTGPLTDHPRVVIIIYSVYGHIAKLAQAVRDGIVAAGGSAQIFRVKDNERVPEGDEKDYPIFDPHDLPSYDAYLFGVPTRFGNFPAQWKTFWDHTGRIWKKGDLYGKFAGVFVSTGTPGGGQETTVINTLSTLAHHGIIFVPLGYAHTFHILENVSEARGGSPWGAGTFAGADGSRTLSDLERDLAQIQGKEFWATISKHKFSKPEPSKPEFKNI